MQVKKFKMLVEKYLDESIQVEERKLLADMLQDPAYCQLLDDVLLDLLARRTYDFEPDMDIRNSIDQFLTFNTRTGIESPSGEQPPTHEPVVSVHRVHFLRKWWWAAAAVFLLLGAGAYLLTISNKTDQSLANGNKRLDADIAPGGERAVLTLADGSRIVLDSAGDGALAQQGNAQVVKLSNGQIVYNLKGASQEEIMMNTMTTPRGGQYQLTLPDGSKVWLNSASSITFPAAFVGMERIVKVTGEVYFEVVRNKSKPFVVNVNDESLVQVLGTSFNINSYADDGNIKTTLLEGSVRIGVGTRQGAFTASRSVTLRPGQQAVVSSPDQLLNVINSADVDAVMAWKNGLFNFQGADVKTVMQQISRWYDLDIRYEGTVPATKFRGKVTRDLNLSQVLRLLETVEIKFRLDGKTLVVIGS